MRAYHLEAVQLLFNLLSKHWRESVACCNLSSAVIFSTCPSLIELQMRAEAYVASNDAPRGAYFFSTGILGERHEIIFALNGDGVRLAMTGSTTIIHRGTGRT